MEIRKMLNNLKQKKIGVKLTAKQEQALEAYKAKDRKVEMAIGGAVTEKYTRQRPEYQAYAEGDVVEDEMPDEDMPPMEELKVEEESLLEPMGMDMKCLWMMKKILLMKT